MFVSALGWIRGWTWLRKDLLDFNLVGAGSDPNSGCLGSVDWRNLSALLAVSLLISGGVIPASKCRLLVLVGLRQPVMVRQALYRAITHSDTVWFRNKLFLSSTRTFPPTRIHR